MDKLKEEKIREIIDKYRDLANSSFTTLNEYSENKTIERMLSHEIFYFKDWNIAPNATIRNIKKEIETIKEKCTKIEDDYVKKKYSPPQFYKTVQIELEDGEIVNTPVPDHEVERKIAGQQIAIVVFPNKVLIDYLEWLIEHYYNGRKKSEPMKNESSFRKEDGTKFQLKVVALYHGMNTVNYSTKRNEWFKEEAEKYGYTSGERLSKDIITFSLKKNRMATNGETKVHFKNKIKQYEKLIVLAKTLMDKEIETKAISEKKNIEDKMKRLYY